MQNLKMFCICIHNQLLDKVKKLNYIPVGLGDDQFDSGWIKDNLGENISKKNKIDECLFATGGNINKQPDLQSRKSGSAALDMAYVAAGRYDGYFQHELNLWDIAAGIVIVKEAGGVINEIDLSQTKNIDVIACTPDIHQKILEKIDNF